MDLQKQLESLARIDGKEFCSIHFRPDYLHPTEGYNHLHRIIGEMEDGQIQDYDIALCLIIKRDTSTILNTTHKSSTAQMAEAILRAFGKWEEG